MPASQARRIFCGNGDRVLVLLASVDHGDDRMRKYIFTLPINFGTVPGPSICSFQSMTQVPWLLVPFNI
jgi:hypothetical protein